jgi:hypothetical protein
LDISRGHAGKKRGVDTALAYMRDGTVHQESEQGAWAAMENTRPGTTTAKHQPDHFPHIYQPTFTDKSVRPRSLIYVTKRISTSSHRQIHCNHPDVVAIKFWAANVQYPFFSVYIPPIPLFQTSEVEPDHTALDEIQATIQQHCSETNQGNFNRQHPAWSDRAIPAEFTERAEKLVNFFQSH